MVVETQAGRAVETQTPRALLWWGAGATSAAALFFPKIEGIRNHGRPAWQLLVFYVPLDVEGLILIPIVVASTFALFWLLGGWAWRDAGGRNSPARVGWACGVLGVVGVVAFWLSAPIVLGGLAVTLGLHGRRLAPAEGRRGEAVAAIIVGACAVSVGAAMWSFIT